MSRQSRNHVLIVYADTGSGHHSVARAIHSALRVLSPDDHDGTAIMPVAGPEPGVGYDLAVVGSARARLHNPVKHHLLGNIFDLYGPMTRRAPRLYAGAYHMSDSERVCDLAGRMAYRLLHRRLNRLVESARPDLIVCVHSLLTLPVLQVLQRGNYDIPLFSVVTDLASIHQSWIVPDVDRCFVPTSEVRDEMISRGMRSEQLRLSGLPVHPDYFARPDQDIRATVRMRLGLRPDVFTVLAMGGGEGIGGLDRIAGRIAESGLPLQMIVVAGRNPALDKNLRKQQQAWRIPHRVYGFADNIPELMQAADVVVTKAGSVTIAEALASGLPIIISSVIEGQESGNVDFLVRNGVGCLARTPDDIVAAIQPIARLGDFQRRELHLRAYSLSAPAAAFEVASQILETLAPDEASRSLSGAEHGYTVEPLFA